MLCYAATNKFYCSPGAFYLYRQRNNSTIGEVSYGELEREMRAMMIGLKYLDKSLPLYVGSDTVRMGKLFLFNFQNLSSMKEIVLSF